MSVAPKNVSTWSNVPEQAKSLSLSFSLSLSLSLTHTHTHTHKHTHTHTNTHTHTQKYPSGTKKDETLPSVTIWMDTDCNMLNEISLIKKNTYGFTHM